MDSASGKQEPADAADITLVQKMLSATSGSLLTGLLGMLGWLAVGWLRGC